MEALTLNLFISETPTEFMLRPNCSLFGHIGDAEVGVDNGYLFDRPMMISGATMDKFIEVHNRGVLYLLEDTPLDMYFESEEDMIKFKLRFSEGLCP